jgi:hydroxyethylthiazole kinase-like uncharacterized protein yjeF
MELECYEYLRGLSPDFAKNIPAHFRITDITAIRSFIRTRKRFSHKGDYGNGALIAGSKGMMGAAVMSAMAFMRSGGGKLTCHIPEIGYTIMQTSVPEAMARTEPGEGHIQSISQLDRYDVVGIGPGLGSYDSTEKLLDDIFSQFNKPLVIDADALNTLSRNKSLLKKIPAGSVLTPHAKEFERLFGASNTPLDTIRLALDNAAQYKIILVVKGPFTLVATPEGLVHFNTTGNPGMATGGTGDVLAGIITGLIGQQYTPQQAAILGVYVHGLAGDLAATELSEEALIASDVIGYLGKAFLKLHK